MDKVRNAAIILIGLGEKCAGEILKTMNPREVRAILEAINNIDDISEDEIMIALENFYKDTNTPLNLDINSKEKLKNSILTTVGSKGLTELIHRVNLDDALWLDLLSKQSPISIAEILEEEHPQFLSALLIIIFNYLSSDFGKKIVQCFPKNIQSLVFKKMTTMGFISQAGLDLLSIFFEQELKNIGENKIIPINGIDAISSIISYLDSETEHQIITEISNENEQTSLQIQDRIFPFNKLTDLDKKSMQLLLKEVSNDDLVMALKGVDEQTREIFMQNMSQKAAEILKDELETKGPVKLSGVSDAQKRIILIAKRLETEEKIILGGKNNPSVVF